MRLYDNAFKSNYEELKTYYPVWYRDVFEMDALWQVFGEQLDHIQQSIVQAVNNNFIELADLETITKLEHFLYITYDGTRTLSERRRLVKVLLAGFSKMSASTLREIIASFTGARAEIALAPCDSMGNNGLYITAYRGDTETLFLADLDTVLRKKLPAHIVYELLIRYALSPVAVGTPQITKAIIEYPLSGTCPEPALLGTAHEISLETQSRFTKALMDFEPTREQLRSGTTPNEALLAAAYTSTLETFAAMQNILVDYIPTSQDSPAGVTPDTSLIAVSKTVDLKISPAVNVQSSFLDYTPCGTKFTE